MILPMPRTAPFAIAFFCLLLVAGCVGDSDGNPAVENTVLAAQLAELDALPLPAGADPEQWTALKLAFADVLRANGGRTASAPPDGLRAAAHLSFDAGTTTLSWGYTSPGDYNQDGLVTVNDLTPLGAHFLKSNGGNPWPLDTIESVVDGNSDGVINISDLTPLGANLGAKVTGYNVYASQDPATDYPAAIDEPSTIAPLATVALAEATGNRTTERLAFTYVAAGHTAADTYWVRPADSALEGTPSNQAPSAVTLDICGQGSGAPTITILEADAPTLDEDRFEWDFDSDGTFDATTSSFGSSVTAYHKYETAGTHTITVRALSDVGMVLGTTTGTLTLSSAPGSWHVHTVDDSIELDDSVPPNFWEVGLTEVDGRPAVAWQWRTGFEAERKVMFYQLADDALGVSWGARQTVESGVANLDTLDLETIGGLPALAYDLLPDDVSPSTVTYHIATDATGTSWSERSVVDSGTSSLQTTMMDLGGTPLLGYTRSNTAEQILATPGATLADPWDLDNRGALGAGSSAAAVALLGGTPALAWVQSDGVNTSVQYMLLDGVATAQTVEVVTEAIQPAGADLLIVDGLPAVLYRSGFTVNYRRATDAAGTAWGPAVSFESFPGVFGPEYHDLALIGGRPAIAYEHERSIIYCQAADAQGTAWGPLEHVMCQVGPRMTLKEIAGRPVIALPTQWDTQAGFPEQVVIAVKD
jgi:hypothetical protein